MRELRNCHIKGNFVTETALSIGAVETNTLSGIYAVHWVVSQNHDIAIPQHSQKRFCRKIFCEEERRAFQAWCSAAPNHPQRALRRDDVSLKEKV